VGRPFQIIHATNVQERRPNVEPIRGTADQRSLLKEKERVARVNCARTIKEISVV